MDGVAAASLIAGLTGVVLTFADYGIKRLWKRKLRQPTKAQIDDFAAPVGQLMARHVDLSLIGPDLINVTEAGAAIGRYLNEGPVTDRLMPPVVQIGMETDTPDELPVDGGPEPEWWAENTPPPTNVQYLP